MKIILYLSFICLISLSNSLPHFIYDGIETYRQCFDDKDEISLTIYGTLIGQIEQEKIEIEDYSLKGMGTFKCFFSENENSINEKRNHKIICIIKGSFQRLKYIIEEPKVHGFDFKDEEGKSTWPEIIEKKSFLIGECDSKALINEEPILFTSPTTNYSNPINKVRKNIIDAILNNLPKRNIINELQMIRAMQSYKGKYNLNETECAYLAYKWIAQNIEYDCYGLNHNQINNGEMTTYNTGKGVSTGISSLFVKICKLLGLEAESITGYYKLHLVGEISSKPNYIWNSVKIDSTYYLIDTIMGAGYCDGDTYKKFFRDFYFCLDPKIFVRGHLPIEDK